ADTGAAAQLDDRDGLATAVKVLREVVVARHLDRRQLLAGRGLGTEPVVGSGGRSVVEAEDRDEESPQLLRALDPALPAPVPKPGGFVLAQVDPEGILHRCRGTA